MRPDDQTLGAGTGEPAVGASIGKYLLSRRLGAGGMGVVYAAYDPELDRKVAIKLLRPGGSLAAEELRARLMREAQAMARLSHPNVITVYEVGTFGEQVFVAMELIDGTTLAEWLRARAAHLARDRARVRRRRRRAGGGARRGPRASRLQARQRAHRARRPRLRHRLRAGAPRQRRASRSRRPSSPSRPLDRDADATRACSSARRRTWRPSRCAASPPTRAPTCSASASRSTRRSTARGRSAARDLDELRARWSAAPRKPPLGRARLGGGDGAARPPHDPAARRRRWASCSPRSRRSGRERRRAAACWRRSPALLAVVGRLERA